MPKRLKKKDFSLERPDGSAEAYHCYKTEEYEYRIEKEGGVYQVGAFDLVLGHLVIDEKVEAEDFDLAVMEVEQLIEELEEDVE